MNTAKAKAGGGAPDADTLLWPELKDGPLEMLYGIFGEEDFLVSQALEPFYVCPEFSQNPSLNIERFSALDTPPSRVLESACTLPFLGSRRLVVVQQSPAYKAAQLNEFLDYLQDPAQSTCMVFSGQKLDTRTKFGKLLKKAAKVHVFKKMYPQELVPWLKKRASQRGNALDHQSAERLAELAGLGLGALDSELEKLSLYAGKRQKIQPADIDAVLGQGRLYSVFDFTDALAEGSLSRALSAWDQLAALGEPAVRVLAMVTRLFRQLLEARIVLDQGGGQREVQSALRTPPAATRTIFQRARQETDAKLRAGLSRILEADIALKSSPGSDRVIMERLVMDLCAD
ncbi:MAG: DNA polymerase III subunit delta [Desulfarculaceae bacterium]|jgi:DNA polymerase-3 subunit delta